MGTNQLLTPFTLAKPKHGRNCVEWHLATAQKQVWITNSIMGQKAEWD